jgi:hypothetical protein
LTILEAIAAILTAILTFFLLLKAFAVLWSTAFKDHEKP